MNFLRYLKMVKFPFYTEQVRAYALPVLLFCGWVLVKEEQAGDRIILK